MLIVNLFGGPGCGKSTTAAALFAHLKNNGIRAELVHEAAKRFIYKGATAQLKNQVYVLAKQWSHIEDLDRAGCEVAISDSPLICNLMYAESHGYYPELKALALKLDDIYPQKNVFIVRTKNFDSFGRTQKTIEEASEYDTKCKDLMKSVGKIFHIGVEGNPQGQAVLGHSILSELKAGLELHGTDQSITGT